MHLGCVLGCPEMDWIYVNTGECIRTHSIWVLMIHYSWYCPATASNGVKPLLSSFIPYMNIEHAMVLIYSCNLYPSISFASLYLCSAPAWFGPALPGCCRLFVDEQAAWQFDRSVEGTSGVQVLRALATKSANDRMCAGSTLVYLLRCLIWQKQHVIIWGTRIRVSGRKDETISRSRLLTEGLETINFVCCENVVCMTGSYHCCLRAWTCSLRFTGFLAHFLIMRKKGAIVLTFHHIMCVSVLLNCKFPPRNCRANWHSLSL